MRLWPSFPAELIPWLRIMEKAIGRLTADVFLSREADIGVSADALVWPKKHPAKVEYLRTVLGGVRPDGGREGTTLA